MRPFLYWMMSVALAMTLATGLAACADDDDDERGGDPVETPDAQAAREESWHDDAGEEGDGGETASEGRLTAEEKQLLEQQKAISSILMTLTGLQQVDTRFDQLTYEPTIGTVLDESNPYVRAVESATPEAAEQKFLDMVHSTAVLSQTADGYTVSLKDMPLMADGTRLTLGTLTFHRGGTSGTSGYVDVDIRCVPHLSRIDYLAPSAFPHNDASNSPYKVGDLVWVDSRQFCSGYYLCVEAAGNAPGILVHLCEGEKKGDETVNFDGDDEGCWIPYNNTRGDATTESDIRAYVSFLINERARTADLKLYLDGHASKKPLHAGKKEHIFPGGFATDTKYVYKSDDGKGGRIFYTASYGDYAWIPPYHYRKPKYMWISNYCQSLTYVKSHELEYTTDSWWDDHVNEDHNFTMNVIHFYGQVEGAVVDYHAMGDNLNFENSADFATAENVGWIFGANRRLYPSAAKAEAAGTSPVGIVAYVNDGSEFGDKVTEKEAGYGHLLVLSHLMTSGGSTVKWHNGSNVMAAIDEWSGFTQYVDKTTGAAAALSDFDGLMKTATLAEQGSPAALAAQNFAVELPAKSSGWFLPSAAQWVAMMCAPGLGGLPMPDTGEPFPTYLEREASAGYEAINKVVTGNQWTYYQMLEWHKYWSSSAYSEKVGVYLTASDGVGTRLSYWTNSYAFVRPVFAY